MAVAPNDPTFYQPAYSDFADYPWANYPKDIVPSLHRLATTLERRATYHWR